MDWRSWCPTAHWFLPSITTTITRSQSVVNCVMGACVFKHHRLICLCEALSNCPALHLKTSPTGPHLILSTHFDQISFRSVGFFQIDMCCSGQEPESLHPSPFSTFCILAIECLFCGPWVILSDHKCSFKIFSVCSFLDPVINAPHLPSSWASDWIISVIFGLMISTLSLSTRKHSLPQHHSHFFLHLFSRSVPEFVVRESQSYCPQSNNLSFFSVSFKKTWNRSSFLPTKIEEIYSLTRTPFVKDIFLLIECNDVHEIHQSAISLAFQMTIKASMWMKKQCLLIITGCGNHNLNLFLQETCCFCFLNQKRAQEQTQIYVVRFSWQQFQKQKKWVKNWEYHFSDLCCMLLDVVGNK